jgi:predicted PurR-regulated permease PerM
VADVASGVIGAAGAADRHGSAPARAGLEQVDSSKITPGVIYRAVLLAFALVIAALIFRALTTLILAILVVVVLAVPLSSFTSLLERQRVPRAVGATLGLLIGLALLGGLIAAIVPVFTHEIDKFSASLPGIVDSLRHRVGRLTGTSATHVGQQIQQFVDGYTHHPSRLLGPVASIGASIAAALAAIVVILLTALYSAIHPEPLVEGLLRVFPPSRRGHAREVLIELRAAYLGWLRGLAVGMLVLGGITYLGLRLVGLQFAAFFSVFTAVAMIIPYFGALASSIPPVVYALTVSTGKAILVAVIYIVAHQLEGNIIQPLVVARAVKMHPAVIAVGVVAVERLFGFVGLIVAVPILVTVKILIHELWVRPMEAADRRLLLARASGAADEPVVVREGLEEGPDDADEL